MSRRLIILVVVLIGAIALTISACSPVDVDGQCTEHVWENEIVMGGATCTDPGKAFQRCTVCGKSQQVDIEPLGHDLVVKDNSGISATCEAEGFTGKLGCARCDYEEEGSVIPALGHNWNAGEITTAPTCEAKGVKTFTCLNDGAHTYTEDVAVIGHAYGEWIQGENGNHKKVCANDDTHVITEACSGGSNRCDELAICAVCGNEYGELKDHVYDQEVVAQEYFKHGANCTDGAIYYMSCICGACNKDVAPTFMVGDPEGHNYDREVASETYIKAPATCETAAVYYTSCVCGAHDVTLSATFSSGDALGHAYGDWEEVTPATCEHDGLEKKVCANDSSHVLTQPIIKFNHAWNNGEVTTDPTCEGEGVKTFTCLNDGTHTYTEPIEALGHAYGNWEEVTPATCTSEGEEKQVCANDSNHVVTRPISKLNHNHNIKSYQIIDGVLKLVRECACGTSQVLDDVDNTATIAVSNASDLEAVLNGGGYAVILEDDITLDNGVITITKDATLYLNGKTITSNVAKITESVVGTKSVCDVFIVRGDVTFNINGDGKLLATNDEAQTVCVLSALDGATVNIYGGEYVSSGCTTIYARTNSVINVFDGKFVAEDNSYGYLYTLDIWEGEDEEIWAEINVYGGEYVAFNPANHQGDGPYTNKLAEGVHSLLVDDAYIVSDHEYDDGVVTAPTCTEQGYTTYTCSCGHNYIGDEVGVDATAHAYGNWEEVTPATCDQDGEEKRVCAHNADHVETQPIAAIGHAYDNGTITTEATCEDEGVKTFVCANDNTHTYTEPVAAIGHEMVEADCLQDAYCKRAGCGHVVEDSALGHDMVEADCENNAYCKRAGCGHVVEDSALGHDMVEATCMQDAYCKREGCGHVVADSKKDHDFTQGNVCPTCASTKKTVNVTIADYADANGWVNDKKYGSVIIDKNITATASGGGNTGKYYTSGTNWRFYQTENPALTLSVAEGGSGSIVSVKITYSVTNTGILTLNGINVTSGSVVNVNNTTITFGVGNTGTATNGQVRITAIEVIYIAPPCKHTDVREDAYKAPTCAEEGREAGTWCNDCENYISGGEEISATGEHTYDETTGVCTTEGCGAKKPQEGGDEPNLIEETSTISFANTTQRTEQSNTIQVWENGGVTLTNNKASSTSNVGNYSNPARFYANSEIIIEANNKKITKIVFKASGSSYVTALKNSIGAEAEVSVSENNVTVVFDTPVDSFTIEKLTAQVRLTSIEVTYLKEA